MKFTIMKFNRPSKLKPMGYIHSNLEMCGGNKRGNNSNN